MITTTTFSWILIAFGMITCIPLLFAQMILLLNPGSQKAKDLLIGKGENWRDDSHYRIALALSWADWLVFFPLFVLGAVGILLNELWGFVLFATAGTIQLYINTFLWFFERDIVSKSLSPLAYYTYYWGNFMYWGLLTLVYCLYILSSH